MVMVGWWTVYFVNKAYLSGFWKLMTLRKVLFPLFHPKHTHTHFRFYLFLNAPLFILSSSPHYASSSHTVIGDLHISSLFFFLLFHSSFPFVFSTEYSLYSH